MKRQLLLDIEQQTSELYDHVGTIMEDVATDEERAELLEYVQDIAKNIVEKAIEFRVEYFRSTIT